MLTKSQIQYIKSLHNKRGRRDSGYFIVEGRKSIEECLHSDFEIVEGVFTQEFMKDQNFPFPTTIVSLPLLSRISTLSSNKDGLLIVKMKTWGISPDKLGENPGITLLLDGINDPGNLGTIIRNADWYGIENIIVSHDTVDCYSPKVIMATMGSFTRVSLFYTDLEVYLRSLSGKPIYGAVLDGEDIHGKSFPQNHIYLLIGSESHGIRPSLRKYITDKISIPRFGSAESLNVGVATAVILDSMMRSISWKKL